MEGHDFYYLLHLALFHFLSLSLSPLIAPVSRIQWPVNNLLSASERKWTFFSKRRGKETAGKEDTFVTHTLMYRLQRVHLFNLVTLFNLTENALPLPFNLRLLFTLLICCFTFFSSSSSYFSPNPWNNLSPLTLPLILWPRSRIIPSWSASASWI